MNTLLQDIQQEILKAGGRHQLSRLLMEENRFAFSVESRILAKQDAEAEKLANYQPESSMYWTPEEVEYLKENYGKRSSKRLAFKLGRTVHSCTCKIYKINRQLKQSA